MTAKRKSTPTGRADDRRPGPPDAGELIIVCPRCNATLPDHAIDDRRRRAVCLACEHRFAIDDQLAAPRPVSRGRRRHSAPPLGVQSQTGPDGLTLVWRWPRWRSTPPLLFLVLFGGLLTFYAVVGGATGTPELMAVLGIFAVACLVLLWLFLAYRLNRTIVVVGGGRLSVRHGPIPWPGRRDLPADSLRQLYSQMYHNHALRRGDGYTSYRLRAVLADGAELLLVNDLPGPEQALYLEQEIERYLGLDDQLARGELPR